MYPHITASFFQVDVLVLPHLTSLASRHKDIRNVLLDPRVNSPLRLFCLLWCKHTCHPVRACEPDHDLPTQYMYLHAYLRPLPQQAGAVVVRTLKGTFLHSSSSSFLKICCPIICPTPHGIHWPCPPLSPLVPTNHTANHVEKCFLSFALN